VTAELVFNDDRELVDFVSDDRLRASANGRTFIPQRWSTPLGGYRTIGHRRIATHGEGRWHAPDPEGEFTYIEFNVDHMTYNPGTALTSNIGDAPGVSAAPSSSTVSS
jgi:hypothetical protein